MRLLPFLANIASNAVPRRKGQPISDVPRSIRIKQTTLHVHVYYQQHSTDNFLLPMSPQSKTTLESWGSNFRMVHLLAIIKYILMNSRDKICEEANFRSIPRSTLKTSKIVIPCNDLPFKKRFWVNP